MTKSDRRAKDVSMAAYMKDHPGSYPSSVNREKQIVRSMAKYGRAGPRDDSRFMSGMFGGVVCAQLGMGFVGQEMWMEGLRLKKKKEEDQ